MTVDRRQTDRQQSCHRRLAVARRKQEAQSSIRWTDVPSISEGQRPTSGRGKSDLPELTAVPYTLYHDDHDAAISNATINAKIRYGNSARTDCCMQAETLYLKLQPNRCR